MAGFTGQHRVQTHKREGEKEKKEVTVYLVALFAGFLSVIYSLIKTMDNETSQPIYVVRVSGNVIYERMCIFPSEPAIDDVLDCGGGTVAPVTLEPVNVCNGCELIIPYTSGRPEVRKMHVLLLHALGQKKCLSEASLKEIESLPGIGPSRARTISSFILSGRYRDGERWPAGIGKRTLEVLWNYFDDCRGRR